MRVYEYFNWFSVKNVDVYSEWDSQAAFVLTL